MKKSILTIPIVALVSSCSIGGTATGPSATESQEKLGILPCSVVSRMIMAKKVSLNEGLQIQCEEDALELPIPMKYEKWCSRVTGVPCTGNPTGWHDVE